MICIICNEKITSDPNGWDGGHNAEPVAEGQCCGHCNDSVVAVQRLVDVGWNRKVAAEWATKVFAENQYDEYKRS